MADRAARSLLRRLVDARFTPEELERLRTLPTRQNEYGYDPFGFNLDDAKVAILFARWLYRHYFRTVARGVEHIPAGRCMLIANHSGQLPYDGLSIGVAALFEGPRPRMVRAMVERFVPTLPYVSYLFARWGQVVGTPENCIRLLEQEELILVFPEGARGISKPFSKRYQLQPFGLGFMRIALATGTPIVPVAVVGAEEQAPAFNLKPVARLLGAPAFPVMPFPPFFPIVPLPARHHLYFGEPQRFQGDPDDDDEEIEKLVRQVKLRIQSLIQVGLEERRGIFR